MKTGPAFAMPMTGGRSGYRWADLAAAIAGLEDHKVTPLFMPKLAAGSVAWLIGMGASVCSDAPP